MMPQNIAYVPSKVAEDYLTKEQIFKPSEELKINLLFEEILKQLSECTYITLNKLKIKQR